MPERDEIEEALEAAYAEFRRWDVPGLENEPAFRYRYDAGFRAGASWALGEAVKLADAWDRTPDGILLAVYGTINLSEALSALSEKKEERT